MDTDSRDAFLTKKDMAADQISAGAPDDDIISEHSTEAVISDGLDDSARIEIALKSDDPEWLAYTLNVLGTVFPVDEDTMIQLEKRARILALDPATFGNELLAEAIVSFIQRRTCEQTSNARQYMYPLLSFLGSKTKDVETVASSTLMRVAADRPEYFERYVDLLIEMQRSNSDSVRAHTAGIVAVLMDCRPEYFFETLEQPPCKPANYENATASLVPEVRPDREDITGPGVNPRPAENPSPLEREAPQEPISFTIAREPIARQARDVERHADTGLRTLASSLAKKIKANRHSNPTARGAVMKASGQDAYDASKMIDNFSDITQLIKTGLPVTVKPLSPAKERTPLISNEDTETMGPAIPVNTGKPAETATVESPKNIAGEKLSAEGAGSRIEALPATSLKPEIMPDEPLCSVDMAVTGDKTIASPVDKDPATPAPVDIKTTRKDDEGIVRPIVIAPEKAPAKLVLPPVNKTDVQKQAEQTKVPRIIPVTRNKIVIRPLTNR